MNGDDDGAEESSVVDALSERMRGKKVIEEEGEVGGGREKGRGQG